MQQAAVLRFVALAGGLLLLPACDRTEASPELARAAEPAGVVAATGGDTTGYAPDAAVDREPGVAAKLDAAPAQIRGIYLNAYAGGSRARLRKLIEMADRTELNTFVIDVKDERGVHFRAATPLAQELAQPGEITMPDLRAITDTLKAHGIYAIARIVVFKDPILSKARPEWSIRTQEGGLWRDKEGNTWVSAWDPAVWDYNIDLAEEAARAGFDEIQFDYVRFPEPFTSLPPQVHPKAAGPREEAIARFLLEARRRLHPLGVRVAADVFGLVPVDPADVKIGQQWETIAAVSDHILPMVYPSHFLPTHLRNVPRPNRSPYEVVYQSIGMGVLRSARLAEAGVRGARIIPWLQAFSAPWVDRGFDYGPEQAAAQIQAVYATGLDDWIFWHPGSKYEQIEAAFARETASRAARFDPPVDLVTTVRGLDLRGVLAGLDLALKLVGTTAPLPTATPARPAAGPGTAGGSAPAPGF